MKNPSVRQALFTAFLTLACSQASAHPAEPGRVTVVYATPDKKVPARLLQSNLLGGAYCLKRIVPDGRGRPVITRMPVRGIQDDAHWKTSQTIDILPFQEHVSNCAKPTHPFELDKLDIQAADGVIKMVGKVKGSAEDWIRVAQRPQNPVHRDSYLFVPASCRKGAPLCSNINAHDAYLYLVNVEAGEKTAKLVFVDFFDPTDVSPACNAERPDLAMDQMAWPDGCPLPGWVSDFFGEPGEEDPLHERQTGTGGGYEPPPAVVAPAR